MCVCVCVCAVFVCVCVCVSVDVYVCVSVCVCVCVFITTQFDIWLLWLCHRYLHVSVCKADRNMVQALLERMSRENLQSMINKQNSMRQVSDRLHVRCGPNPDLANTHTIT